MNKRERELIFNKFGGRCAYCGCELQKGWNVDHIEPRWHTWSEEDINRIKAKSNGKTDFKKGANDILNYNPSCPRCNKWKSTHTIEQFRQEISLQIIRLKRDSSNFRIACDYNLITETQKPVQFYFETINPSHP